MNDDMIGDVLIELIAAVFAVFLVLASFLVAAALISPKAETTCIYPTSYSEASGS